MDILRTKYNKRNKYIAMKTALLIILNFIIILSFAQKTERFNGDFFNGDKIKGTASYTFYRDDNNKQIKEGTFRYSAREKNDKYRYSHSISGNYKKGLKNDKWTYNYSTKDYKQDKDGYYYSINVELNSQYDNGYPSGKWVYNSKIVKYKKILKKGKYKKTNPVDVKDLSITINWVKNRLVDSLIINNRLGESIYVTMDSEGVMNGEFYFLEDQKEFWYYENGILKNKGIDTNVIVNKEYSSYNKINDQETTVKKIKKSLLSKDGCLISKYIKEEIYNHDYTLFRYIGGDNIIKTNKKTNNKKLVYNGLYYYKLKPILTKDENEIIKSIVADNEKVRQAEWFTNQQILKNPKEKKYKEDKARIVYALKEFDEVNCYISYYKNYLSLDNIKIVTQTNCGTLDNSALLMSKYEYLEEIRHKADQQMKILKAYNQFK